MTGTGERIPKIIHYCWFGGTKKPDLVKQSIESWKVHLPHFVIKEWSESNFDWKAHPFSKRMYETKKWAFVADYARLEILSKYGGVYLDTDMLIVKDITPLLDCELLLGKESETVVSGGMIGAIPRHPFIEACRNRYETMQGLPTTIPRLLTEVYKEMRPSLSHVTVCDPDTFYPYSPETISRYGKELLPEATYGVHLWNYSWGHPVLRAANKLPIYHSAKKLLNTLGLKRMLKKILGLS